MEAKSTTIFDYVRRTMPFTALQSLCDDEVYSLVAYLLVQNGIISEDTVVSHQNLAVVSMPNRDGFVCDSRPDTFNGRCMNDCAEPGDKDFREGEVAAVATIQADCMIYQ
jgi:cytochrome c